MRVTIPPTSGVQFEMPWPASTSCVEKFRSRRPLVELQWEPTHYELQGNSREASDEDALTILTLS